MSVRRHIRPMYAPATAGLSSFARALAATNDPRS